MISPRLLRRRIRSVQGTAKITRAMEMIATAKMKRSQDAAVSGRPYTERIMLVVGHLAASLARDPDNLPPIMKPRSVKRIGVVHVTSDRGLCGGLNANLNRSLAGFVLKAGTPVSVVSVGKKGRDFCLRNGLEVRAEFTGLGDRPGMLDILPIARVVMDDFMNGYVDQVYVSYSQFITTVVQRPNIEQIIPVDTSGLPQTLEGEYIYEPSPSGVLGQLAPRFVEMEVYHAISETIASEQSARMVAMRNATDSANEMVGDLTLALNKARQEMITKELLDITGGVAALG